MKTPLELPRRPRQGGLRRNRWPPRRAYRTPAYRPGPDLTLVREPEPTTAEIDEPGLSAHALRMVAMDLRAMAREATSEAAGNALLLMAVRFTNKAFALDLAEQAQP